MLSKVNMIPSRKLNYINCLKYFVSYSHNIKNIEKIDENNFGNIYEIKSYSMKSLSERLQVSLNTLFFRYQ